MPIVSTMKNFKNIIPAFHILLIFFVTYEFVGPDITEDEIKELEEIASKEIDQEVIDRGNFVEGITENLKTVYKLVASRAEVGCFFGMNNC